VHLYYTPDQQALRDELAAYFSRLMTPEVQARVSAAQEEGGPAMRELVRQIGTDGWLGVGWPEEYGGRGFGPIEQHIFFEEAMTAEVPVPLLFGDEVPAALALRRADGAMELPVDDPTAAGADPTDVVPATGPAAMPLAETGVCGATAVCGAGLELSPVTFGVWLTKMEPAAVGVVVLVLLVSDCTTLGAPTGLGALGALGLAEAAWRTASEGFEPPLPLSATAVGAGCTVVLVAGAAVVGGVAGATVVTGALLAAGALLDVP